MTFADILARSADLPAPDTTALAAAEARQAQLTKPQGALGRLEDIAIWLAGWQGQERPNVSRPMIKIFAGNHGVAAKGVSAFPSDVTVQMVANFKAGGAAANQLARLHGASFDVIALDLERPTADFTERPAMSEQECCAAIAAGWAAIERCGADLLCLGEMGIGNTTSAAAISAALFGGAAEDWVGRGTGIDDAGHRRKIDVVKLALARHKPEMHSPLDALARLGGREIAAAFGALLAARHERIPVLLDGFVIGAAASVLFALNSDGLSHCLAAHASAEAGHRRMLSVLGMRPLLQLDMRLGEGSGALAAIGLVQAALAAHNGMATFAEAAVSGKG